MKKTISVLIASMLLTALSANASAADYIFNAQNKDDFYRSTTYEDVYGSAYNYGGQNVTDFATTSLLPGIISPTPETASASDPGVVIIDTSLSYGLYDNGAPISVPSEITSYPSQQKPALTPTSGLKRSDGSIGTLVIPSLSINMKVYEGTTSTSMSKGVGHFAETSGWSGNIGLCGHNRNSRYVIGPIKDLKIGDTIEYSTTLGTRCYAVTFVGTISVTDWSYLSPSADNRITIITCLADQPTLRVCVQAVEKR